MKKLLLLLLSVSLLTLSLNAQSWIDLGLSTRPTDFAQSKSFDVDDGKIYVVENMPSSGFPNETRLSIYNRTTGWDSIASLANAWVPNISVENGIPYVSYSNTSSNFNITASKFDNNIWSFVGGATNLGNTFTIGTRIVVENGNVYLSFVETNPDEIKVMKYNGNTWSLIGNVGFANFVTHYDLAVHNGVPYVAFNDASASNKTTVMKHVIGLGWVAVGNIVGISSGGSSFQEIEINDQGIPYVAYVDSTQQNKVTVQKFDGTNWLIEGVAGAASLGSIQSMDLGINSLNEVFVAYTDFSTNKANLNKYDGTDWTNVGGSNFSPNSAPGILLAFNGETPCVAFRDGSIASTRVMVYCAPTASTINEITCSSYTSPSGNYTWTSSGTYLDTIPNSNFCDSVITVNLVIQNSTSSSENVTACNIYTWPTNNATYNLSGSYTDTVLSSVGCDSVLTLNLTINTNTTSSTTVGACDTYTWAANNQTYTSSGVYTTTIPNSVGCDSILTLNLTISSASTSSVSITACDAYTWAANNQTYLASGSYTTTTLNSVGCDSTITLNLTIYNSSTITESVTTCDSYFWIANAVTYTTSGIYSTTFLNSVGCDSTLILDLSISYSSSSSETVGACDSYTWPANNQTYTSSGVYTTTILNSVGCDSNLTLNLTISSASTSSASVAACDSYTWAANNLTYFASGTFTETVLNSVGCDSTITLNLTILNSSTSSETVTACDSYFWIANAVTYTSSGNYTTTTLNSVGCDSVLTLDLTINNSTSSTETVGACDTYTWAANNQTYTSSGGYTTTIPNSAGCDSNMTLNLTISSASTSSVSISACDSYIWDANNQTYTASGTFTETILNSFGCDSTITLNLTILNSSASSEMVTACESYFWIANAVTYTSSGNYTTTTLNSVGCDSILTLDLTINNSSTSSFTIGACDSYVWEVNNQVYTFTSSGTYTATIPNAAGCDSVLTLNLSIGTADSSTVSVTECDAYTWAVNNQTYTASGSYSETILNSFGCDSTITLNLTINNSSTSTETVTACDTYDWALNNVTYTQSGMYSIVLPNSEGCDSTIVLDLTINESSTAFDTIRACDSYTWPVNNVIYTVGATYTAVIPNSIGCDSTVTLKLKIYESNGSIATVEECDSFTWTANNVTYTSSGVYSTTLVNSNGCDSVLTLNLTINNSNGSTLTVEECDSFTWTANNVTYSSSGVYSTILQNVNGCDSLLTLNLTINNSYASTENVVACDIYFWGPNSSIYTESGLYSASFLNANGCDSVLTLHLTINQSDSSSQTISACDSYTWSVNNNTYTSSGSYVETLVNSNGCDSIVTLDLTINNSNAATINEVSCDSFLWQANNVVYASSGSYTASLINQNGCDSIVTLNLVINNSSYSSDTIVACYNYTWSANNQTYLTSGDYSTTLSNANGCDSILTLSLTINDSIDLSVVQSGNTLSSNATGANITYQWVDCNNNYVAISADTNYNFMPNSNGSYAVVIDDGFCRDTSDCYSILNVGIFNHQNTFKMSVYPNPANNYLELEVGNINIQNISIIDVTGKSIVTYIGNNNRVDVSALFPGSYFIKVQSNHGYSVASFIKY